MCRIIPQFPYVGISKGKNYGHSFLVLASQYLTHRNFQIIKKARALNRKEKRKIHIIKRASDGTRPDFETWTKGLKSPVFMRVFWLQHPLQNLHAGVSFGTSRVRVLLPLPWMNHKKDVTQQKPYYGAVFCCPKSEKRRVMP